MKKTLLLIALGCLITSGLSAYIVQIKNTTTSDVLMRVRFGEKYQENIIKAKSTFKFDTGDHCMKNLRFQAKLERRWVRNIPFSKLWERPSKIKIVRNKTTKKWDEFIYKDLKIVIRYFVPLSPSKRISFIKPLLAHEVLDF